MTDLYKIDNKNQEIAHQIQPKLINLGNKTKQKTRFFFSFH